MKKILEVKQCHIDKGIRGNSMSCPIALALNDIGYDNSYVGYDLYKIKGIYKHTTTRMKRFISKFDNKKTVKPCNFRIEIDKVEHVV